MKLKESATALLFSGGWLFVGLWDGQARNPLGRFVGTPVGLRSSVSTSTMIRGRGHGRGGAGAGGTKLRCFGVKSKTDETVHSSSIVHPAYGSPRSF